MSKSTDNTVEDAEEPQEVDVSTLAPEQQLDVSIVSLDAFCSTMRQQGIDPTILSAALLDQFAAIMAEEGDREAYEDMLAEALDAEWIDQTIH